MKTFIYDMSVGMYSFANWPSVTADRTHVKQRRIIINSHEIFKL